MSPRALRFSWLFGLALFSCAKDPTPATPHAPANDETFEERLVPLVHLRGTPEHATLAARMAYYRIPGVSVAIMRDGHVVMARGYGVLRAGGAEPVTTETSFEAASISKPVTDLAAVRLSEERVLDLDANVDRYLTSWHVPPSPELASRPPTLRMIMSHTAGFNVESVAGYPQGTPLPTLVQALAGAPPTDAPAVRLVTLPGAEFNYSAGGLAVLEQALVDTTKTPFDALMRREVLDPLGMSRSTFEQPPSDARARNLADGHDWRGVPSPTIRLYPEQSAAGLHSTPTDLAQIVIEVQRALSSHGAVLTVQGARAMTTPQNGFPVALGFFVSGEGAARKFSHDGWNYGFTSRLEGYVEHGDGAVVMTNGDSGGLMFEVLAAIAETYHWPTTRRPPREADPIDPAVLDRLVGSYAWADGVVASVVRDGARLFVVLKAAHGMEPFPPAELFSDPSGDGFFSVFPKMRVRFEVEAQSGGRVVALSHDETGREVRAPRN